MPFPLPVRQQFAKRSVPGGSACRREGQRNGLTCPANSASDHSRRPHERRTRECSFKSRPLPPCAPGEVPPIGPALEKPSCRPPPALRRHVFEAEIQKPADSPGPRDFAAGGPPLNFIDRVLRHARRGAGNRSRANGKPGHRQSAEGWWWQAFLRSRRPNVGHPTKKGDNAAGAYSRAV